MSLLNKIFGIEKGIEEVTRNLMNLMRDVMYNANTSEELEEYLRKSGVNYNTSNMLEEKHITFVVTLRKDNWVFTYDNDCVKVYNSDSYGDFYPINIMLYKDEQIIRYIVSRTDRQPGELGQIMLKKLKLFGARDLHEGHSL